MAKSTIKVGNVEILSLSDGSLDFDLCNFFPAIPSEKWEPYGEHLTPERHVQMNLASYLVRSAGRTVLVDTGLGPKPKGSAGATWGELLDNLKAAGVSPGDVNMVVMTHLHRDHIAWNLRREGNKYQPVFPKARYWMAKKDWEACHRPEVQKERFPNAPSCVWPLEELGLAELIDGEHVLTPELTALPTPGHTPGHTSILVSSKGQKAIILGDVLHNPVQVHETDWCSRADMDVEVSRTTRRNLMERLEREGTTVAAGHLPAPGFGRIVRLKGRRAWQGL